MHLRRLVRAVPLTWWLAAIALFFATSTMVGRALHVADESRARWGATQVVLVASRALPAGTPLTLSDASLRAVPRALVPEGAAGRSELGRVTLDALARGEIVLTGRLAGRGRTGPAALLGPGDRAVALPIGPAEHPTLAVGDRVDLVGVPADGGPPGVLARAVAVVGVADELATVTVALDPTQVLAVAAGLERGRVLLALVG